MLKIPETIILDTFDSDGILEKLAEERTRSAGGALVVGWAYWVEIGDLY
jgi:hypothetical protein